MGRIFPSSWWFVFIGRRPFCRVGNVREIKTSVLNTSRRLLLASVCNHEPKYCNLQGHSSLIPICLYINIMTFAIHYNSKIAIWEDKVPWHVCLHVHNNTWPLMCQVQKSHPFNFMYTTTLYRGQWPLSFGMMHWWLAVIRPVVEKTKGINEFQDIYSW